MEFDYIFTRKWHRKLILTLQTNIIYALEFLILVALYLYFDMLLKKL